MSVQLSLQRTHSQQSNDPQTNSIPLRVDQAGANQAGADLAGVTQAKDGHRSLIRSSASPISLFHSIPPERVGLQGEYDHHGLAKRVGLKVRQNCAADQIGHLRISQRGAVVVLMGKIANQRLLIKLVNLALSTTGAADVEVNGVIIGDSLKNYLEVKPNAELLQQLKPLVESSPPIVPMG